MPENVVRQLHFDVSSGLKSVLGSELITDDEVAVFELVKNSFDADAKRVDLHFGKTEIVVADDGAGMSFQDLEEKWLFVAYSAKRDLNRPDDFRHTIAERRNYAGSKGIGRFSSDRLGESIRLQTRPKAEETGPVHNIVVDWAAFDRDHRDHFDQINVQYRAQPEGFVLPAGIPKRSHGTAVTIQATRQVWDREKILRLKSALAKLINPFGVATDGFKIIIHAPAEEGTDRALEELALRKRDELPQNAVVNGEVGNFIFSTLQEKTTFIDVRIEPTGEFIESSLTDRGELIYRIREPNEYPPRA